MTQESKKKLVILICKLEMQHLLAKLQYPLQKELRQGYTSLINKCNRIRNMAFKMCNLNIFSVV